MTRQQLLAELARMSAAERILLAQDLWDTVADDPAAWELSGDQQEELDRRLEAYRARVARGESAGSSWEEVKGRVRQQP